MELSSELTKMFSEVTLENVFSTHNLEFEDMKNQYERMIRDAQFLCQHSESSLCKWLLFTRYHLIYFVSLNTPCIYTCTHTWYFHCHKTETLDSGSGAYGMEMGGKYSQWGMVESEFGVVQQVLICTRLFMVYSTKIWIWQNSQSSNHTPLFDQCGFIHIVPIL